MNRYGAKHFGGGPVQGGIGKVGKAGKSMQSVSKPMNVSSAISSKIDLTGKKASTIHGNMKGQSSGSHGGNVKAGKYHKPFGG